MHALLNTAVAAAREAGDIISRSWRDRDLLKIEEKAAGDFVTEVDRQAEQAIIRSIKSRYPDHNFIGEESGEQIDDKSDVTWIIDPLDGTTNFLRGIPQFAVSIACMVGGRIEHAVVYDPIKNEEFTASRGQGASLNDRRIRVSNRRSLQNALLSTGIPFSGVSLQHMTPYLTCMASLLNNGTAGIRRCGAASLDLAYLAAGRFDGFWEIELKPWDIAAGILIVKEAGGMVSDTNGGEEYLKQGHLLCGSPRVYREMLPVVRKYLGPVVR